MEYYDKNNETYISSSDIIVGSYLNELIGIL